MHLFIQPNDGYYSIKDLKKVKEDSKTERLGNKTLFA